MIFDRNPLSELNEDKLLKHIGNILGDISDSVVLDFGCGLSMLYNKIASSKFIVTDVDSDSLSFQRTYGRQNIVVEDIRELKELNVHINYVLVNSVIQYMDPDTLESLLVFLTKDLQVARIIISDIPRINRFLEFCLLPFSNFRHVFPIYKAIYSNISKSSYSMLKFRCYRKKFFKEFSSNSGCQIEICRNFYLFKTRYTVIVNNS